MAAAWMVRAGRDGEREDAALEQEVAIAGWAELGDLSKIETRDELRVVVREAYPDRRNAVTANWTGQLWRFMKRIQVGDLIVVPLRRREQLAIGSVSGGYEYRVAEPPGLRHVRPVKWLRTDLPRSAVQPDLQNSMSALPTVFELKRHDAPRRLQYLAEHGIDPGREPDEVGGNVYVSRDELLNRAADQEKSTPLHLTIRELLALWDAGRRTASVVAEIESELSERGLTTRPPFTEGWIDNTIELVPLSVEQEPAGMTLRLDERGEDASPEIVPPEELPPVSLRIDALESANRPVLSVHSSDTLVTAMTRMVQHDYSQLAVFDEAGVVRAVSWESIARAHLGKDVIELADVTVPVRVVDHDADLLAQVDEIYKVGYVFVRDSDGKITGIVTTADLTRQFATMARPITRIEEIERRLRRRVDEVFTLDQIRSASRHPHKVKSAANLTLGEYKHLLKTEDEFARLGWRLDYEIFCRALETVKDIRNDLMHFSTDPPTPPQLADINGLIGMLRAVDPRP